MYELMYEPRSTTKKMKKVKKLFHKFKLYEECIDYELYFHVKELETYSRNKLDISRSVKNKLDNVQL